jgi:hypothetical protein
MDTGRCPNCGAAYALVGLRHNCRPHSGPVAPTEQQVVGPTSKPVGPTLTNNQDGWMSRALKAEAEVTRLRALLDAPAGHESCITGAAAGQEVGLVKRAPNPHRGP